MFQSSDLKSFQASGKRQGQAEKTKKIYTPGHSTAWQIALRTKLYSQESRLSMLIPDTRVRFALRVDSSSHAKGRNYTCDCGQRSHRYLVGAINIIEAPVIAGAA